MGLAGQKSLTSMEVGGNFPRICVSPHLAKFGSQLHDNLNVSNTSLPSRYEYSSYRPIVPKLSIVDPLCLLIQSY